MLSAMKQIMKVRRFRLILNFEGLSDQKPILEQSAWAVVALVELNPGRPVVQRAHRNVQLSRINLGITMVSTACHFVSCHLWTIFPR